MTDKINLEKWDESPWEWGIYFERNDGYHSGTEKWVPMTFGGFKSFEVAQRLVSSKLTSAPKIYRDIHIVRRAVSPWEVVEP